LTISEPVPHQFLADGRVIAVPGPSLLFGETEDHLIDAPPTLGVEQGPGTAVRLSGRPNPFVSEIGMSFTLDRASDARLETAETSQVLKLIRLH
jgi:hypothetical protein